ncbi:MAG: DUF1573 domain-containing protein [Bacteroidales bacterium]|nr:DUF1573 domain-containing protein [Bacteroidales bacterium]
MKKYILTFGLFLMTVVFLNAQVDTKATISNKSAVSNQKEVKQAEPTGNDNPNAPVMIFENEVHDYGIIEQNADGRCEFSFKNEGKEPLILSNVRSSCGCTVPEWPRQPILPGQSEVIKVKYDTKRVGVINKSVYVYSNAKVSPITLKIKGKVESQNAQAMPEKKMDDAAAPVNK